MLYDLSPPIDSSTPVWPGDTAFSCHLAWAIAQGASVNVGAITSTTHLGSHTDAPFHFDPAGATAADLPLEPYLGPCRVIEIPGDADLALVDHLGDVDLRSTPRLLLKTGSVTDRSRFPERFTAISVALAEHLGAAGALLVGTDAPSVDPFTSKTLAAHHALARGRVAILEGLVLDEVPAGVYELIALPLRLRGADASPVRAVLRDMAG
jgi:arylformamidase